MAFFMIAPCVMAVSIILVRNVSSSLGLEIKYSTLLVCAVLSLVTLFGAMKISPIPDKNFFLYLALLVLPAAAVVAALNNFLVQRDKQAEIDFTEEVRRAYEEATKKSPTDSETELDFEETDAQIPNAPTTNAQIPSLENQSATDAFENFKSLAELVEFARNERKRGNLRTAAAAYQKALDEYPADDYAPFVAIDLGAIYREHAIYSKAIKVYEQAMTLPIVKKHAEVSEEFQKKIVYLETVQAVLFRHKALTTPFNSIPREFFQEIETEFSEQWRRLKFSDQKVQAKK